MKVLTGSGKARLNAKLNYGLSVISICHEWVNSRMTLSEDQSGGWRREESHYHCAARSFHFHAYHDCASSRAHGFGA